MEMPGFFINTSLQTAVKKSRLLPFLTVNTLLPVSCLNCRFINKAHYTFCTNCGFPTQPNHDNIALYNHRLNERKLLQKHCLIKISQARNALYIVAAVFMFGIFYLFSGWKETVIRGLIMVTLGVIYWGLGRWSHQKPFTSLLISLLIMLTFAAVNTWSELVSKFSPGGGLYMLFLQMILIYFLLQGVKGAFHADILEEEFKL
jgi:hypothetical protein